MPICDINVRRITQRNKQFNIAYLSMDLYGLSCCSSGQTAARATVTKNTAETGFPQVAPS